MKRLRIGDIARMTGMRTSAIRYYESIGLVPPAVRESGWRVYGEEVVNRLQLIRWATDCGFTLREIRDLLRDAEKSGSPAAAWERHALAKREEIDRQIAGLVTARARLDLTEDCHCGSLDECSTRLSDACA